jgi:hypothetical protein
VRDDHTHCTCNCVLLCWRCHIEVHANPVAAKMSGWIVSRFTEFPYEVPMVTSRHHHQITWQHNCTGDAVGMQTFSD